MDIKEIVAKNLISLRKKHNLTQNELAKKLNYSDNTISRWEHAEISPSLESLQAIGEVFNVSVELLISSNLENENEQNKKASKINSLVTCLLCASLIWFLAVVTFFCFESFHNLNLWMLFIWAVPATFLLLFVFGFLGKKKIYSFIMLTLFIWSALASIYLQFLKLNLYLVFILGVPIQAAWSIWNFVRPNKKNRNKQI